ncbi:mycofactocin-coupled SDR family oxidoreductase [Rhodococcus sp. T2V]|uniref:mycofactocin-coupled SDR family oxidoreductase n=1 Tax=Rhodococcus sp. T2V TaxID=3034164 RepID=UPI0023E2C21E|nr:mycofactocin-coupled SDR family oxidoreductase [Rhodococcus sp. T2V]MDF3310563.1 mycofactocin-coupled SDR family oxidoreductase [Rhodococcus sp. T2V]
MTQKTTDDKALGRLTGQVAFVTGAARGQGRSHALRMAQEGADIIAVDVCAPVRGLKYSISDRDDLDETVRLVRETGRRIITAVIDVRDAAALRAFVSESVAELGRLDVVAANAGISCGGLAHELPAEDWRTVIDVNLTGVWNTCSAAIPHLIQGGRGGSIVITSSALGLRGMQKCSAYAASKHGVVGLMRALAIELGPHSIRVNSIHPSQVNTPMIMNDEVYRLFAPDLAAPTQEDFAVRSSTMHTLPAPWVEPNDISEAVLYLSSAAGRFVTGIALPVDAGNVMR